MHPAKARYLEANSEYRKVYRRALEAWFEWDKLYPNASPEQRLVARFEIEHEVGLPRVRTQLAEAEAALIEAFADAVRKAPEYQRIPDREKIEQLLQERPVWAFDGLIRLALQYL